MTLKNSIATLPQALSGIVNLDYDKKQIKLVFVDGGSNDGSFEVLKDFCQNNRQIYKDVLVMSGDYNVIEGRNMCIRDSEGDLILFIDSDVVVPSNLLLEVLKIFSSDPKIAFINIPCIVEEERAGWVDKFYMAMGEPQGMSCAAISLSALNEVGSYFVGFAYGENTSELIYRLRKRGYNSTIMRSHALHIKQKPRGFMGYVRTSFTAAVIYHSQEIKEGKKYPILKYIYYTTLLFSPVILLFSIPIFILLFIPGISYYLIRSKGSIYSLPALFVGMILPIGMFILILRVAIERLKS